MIDYQKEFPIPFKCLPSSKLKDLLTVTTADNPSEKITVASSFESTTKNGNRDALILHVACIPAKELAAIQANAGATWGACQDLRGSIDCIVTSWNDSSHYSYLLSEKIWTTLHLTPRAIGNSEQKLIYDDLSLPLRAVAEGEMTYEHHSGQSRAIEWTMRNDYIRNYLSDTQEYGVRVFFYETYIKDCTEVRTWMNGQTHHHEVIGNGWCELDIREHNGKLLLQTWCCVLAITPELCPKPDVSLLIWPDDTKTAKEHHCFSGFGIPDQYAYLDDKCLERYEKDSIFDTVPVKNPDRFFFSNPEYKGQWDFEDCRRIGRNVLKLSLRELYKNVPPCEILHIHEFAISKSDARCQNLEEEHIVSKSDRLLLQLIDLGENLYELLRASDKDPSDVIEFTRKDYKSERFRAYPIFQKLAQVAPLDMSQQDFLARCKTLHEIIAKLKTGPLKEVLISMGLKRKDLNSIQQLKLLQGLSHLLDDLNANAERWDTLPISKSSVDWKKPHTSLAPLFINNDLRNVYAHEKINDSINRLEELGFDSAYLNDGYGRALDCLLDRVIEAIELINQSIQSFLSR